MTLPHNPSPDLPTSGPANQDSQLTGQLEIPLLVAQEVRSGVQNITQLQKRLQAAQTAGVTEFFQILLVATLALEASDIHIEPGDEHAKIRLRIDGMLHDILEISPEAYATLLSRIKLVARLKLNVADKPQDGRFSFSLGQKELIESRVASIPAEYGESLVLRVLNPKNFIAIDRLGLRAPVLEIIQKELKRPNGMMVATGPTGSGKTTTLYAFLKEIARPEIKIVTIEDPIEYHLEGVSQTQVNPQRGYDFASGLQAIVRQDPDVILVGEVRDETTAQIALQAALTGHLVFSTLHTNDAAGTISRLQSLKAKPVNIGSASNVIIGQRLCRKVCSQCALSQQATNAEIAKIKKELQGIQDAPVPSITPRLTLLKARGCSACNEIGYKGRSGIFEVLVVDSPMEEFILTKPSTSAIQKFAIKQGMTTMYQDGLLKVLQGITTLEELERVVGGQEETT